MPSATLGKDCYALDKGFIECNTRQKSLGKDHSANPITAKTILPSIFVWALGKTFTESQTILGKVSTGGYSAKKITNRN